MNLSDYYDKLKFESDNFKNEKLTKLSYKTQNIINCIIFNFDINILKLKNKNFETCFEIRNDLILTLSNLLED